MRNPFDMRREKTSIILVGTYRPENAAWIAEKRLYNLPLPKCGKLAFHECVDGIVLFAEGERPLAFKANFREVVGRAGLVSIGYQVAEPAVAHGEAYALYELTKTSTPLRLLGCRHDHQVYVASSRCPCVRIDSAFYGKPYPKTGGRSMPFVFDSLRPYVEKGHSAQLFDPVQDEFFQDYFSFDYGLKVAGERLIAAHSAGELTCVEICAGAGGQALGLDRAGFRHIALVEYEEEYCAVLRRNRPQWNVICGDVHCFDGTPYQGVDLLAGGVPCPPFSVASRQLGEDDERDLFPQAIRLISEIRPRAVMLENVRGLLDPKFDEYRTRILASIARLGYYTYIRLLQSSDYGVPQIRPRVIIIGIRKDQPCDFVYPAPVRHAAPTVGEALRGLMGARGWRGLESWVSHANRIAPTVVGGSKKHGGPDLGPTRARRAWAELDVDGLGIANEPPPPDFKGSPRLTKEMVARIQGFPAEWDFGSRKTAACRMIGNAFPPPVAQAVGVQIRRCLNHAS